MSDHMKRLAAPRSWPLKRKVSIWVTKQSAGAHSIEDSMSAVTVLRDMVGACDTAREAKRIIGNREMFVDGKAVKNPKAPVGFMDVITIPKMNLAYRMLLTDKGKLTLVPIDEAEAAWELCKIENKTVVKGGKIQLNLSGGRNIVLDKNDYKCGDSLKVAFDGQPAGRIRRLHQRGIPGGSGQDRQEPRDRPRNSVQPGPVHRRIRDRRQELLRHRHPDRSHQTPGGFRMNAMRDVHVDKVVVNIGVGEAGERLVKAQKVLEMVTGQKSVETISKTVNRDLGIRKGMPLGCKVTLRGETAEEFLDKALSIRERRVPEYSFDKEGNMSFGISDYTDFEGMKYDPEIGIFGMDINVVLRRPGNRITQRALLKRRVPKKHRVERDEAIQYMKDKFEVEVVQ